MAPRGRAAQVCIRLISLQLDTLIWETASLASPRTHKPKIVNESLHAPYAVTYIRVSGHFIFQPYRNAVACVTRHTLGAPFIVHPQNGDAACETAAFIGTLKSVFRRKYCLLVHIVNINRKNIYEILLNAMFLQCKN